MKMNLEEIKKRVDDATPGKWEARGESDPYISEVEVDNGFGKESIVSSQKHGDIEFIAHARQDIPNLIAEVERLRKALEFYANPYHNTNISFSEQYSIVAKDNGETARQALRGDSDG